MNIVVVRLILNHKISWYCKLFFFIKTYLYFGLILMLFIGCLIRALADDPDCAKYLPLSSSGEDLYKNTQDGILLWWVEVA